MADWPELAELKKRLDVDDDGGDDWTTDLERVLASAIAHVKAEVGEWDEDTDEPDDSLAHAALRMAELMAQRPENAAAAGKTDPTYLRAMYGHRRSFGIA